MSTVLVSGGSGFISAVAASCNSSLQAIRFITIVRDLKREGEVRSMLRQGGQEPGACLSFFATDLLSDAGWSEAVTGCDYVLHVASPVPAGATLDENDLILPAREGVLRVLRASRDAGVKRVVLTSSFAAIGYGHKPRSTPFSEVDWTDLSGDGLAPYPKIRKPWRSVRPGISWRVKAKISSCLS